MRHKGIALVIAVGGMLVSTLTVARAQNNVSVTVQQVTVNNPGHTPVQGCVDYATGKIWVTGMGVPADAATTNLQRKATARTAARDDALRNLVAILSGVNVSNDTRTVLNKLEKDIIETSCRAFIRAGRMVDNPQQLPAGVDVGPIGLQEEEENGQKSYLYIVAMEVPLYGPASAAHVIMQSPQAPQTPAALAQAHPSAPAQYQDVPATGDESRAIVPGGQASGLIVDCTGLPVRPAMAPVIYNQGTKTAIYPMADVSTDAAVKNGVVGYVTSIDAAKKLARAGANPVVVRAVAMPNNGLEGKSFDVVVSADDAKAIQDADQQGKFLSRCAVVFVLKP